MKSSPKATPPKASETERAYPAEIASLQDKLLLSIRDGVWTKVSALVLWLAPRVDPDLVIQRYLDAGGTHEKKLEHKAGEGQKLCLKDILAALKKKKLIAVRATEDGEDEVQVTPQRDSRFDIDPEFQNLLPRSPDELLKLEERLLVEEARDPLVIWKEQRLLVDGHTRFAFFSLLGRNYEVVEKEFADRAAVIEWMYDTHYGRRNFSAEMKAYTRGKAYIARKQKHGGSRRTTPNSQVGNLKKTADRVAAEYSVGRNTILRDADFAEALDKIAGVCGDEVRQKVLARVARWTRRDVERLVKLEPTDMQEIVQRALVSKKRPKFPAPTRANRSTEQSIHLPKDKPLEQARLLRKALGGKGLVSLHRAIARLIKKRKNAKQQ